MSGYIGTKASVTQVDGYNRTEADDRYVNAAGDTMTGDLTVEGAFTSVGIDDNASSNAMTIDSSGNVLVGTTNTNPVSNNVDGTAALTGGGIRVSRTGEAAGFNRKGSHGVIVDFRKDGTTVGSIGTIAPEIYIGSSAGSGLFFGNLRIAPMNNMVQSDNIIDMGHPSYRFDDIYATNGTIQTSDRNEKQDIDVLSEAETRVAQACKGLLRKFRWKDAVAEKGDDARIHFGIIAQDLQDAFAAEGLDAGRYAMFISSTWWEADEVIPAVEEVLDEEGNVVTEAQPERTVTHHYETAEEAPEGAVERTRLGVRYPELLAFIIGAM